ncbi:MAG: tetratricopeptide repeat protein [Deltaproteobacteria bacterium]|nr:tetratricopeptide repeat protein [Deltaproteobacteria bacterium]
MKNGKGERSAALMAELEKLAEVAPEHKRSFVKETAAFLAFLAVLGGVYVGYKTWAKQAGQVFDTLREVRDIQRQDSYDKLKESKAKLEETMAVKQEGRLVSLLAETDVLLACVHLEGGDTRADAEKWTAKAAADDVLREERYSAEGYLKICDGKAAEAEEYLARILNKGASQPRIYHALGLAMMAQGKLVEADAVLKQAAEKGPGNPRFPYSYGEVLLRQGQYWEAVQQYTRAVNINGSHVMARVGKALAEGMAGISAEKVLKDIEKALEGAPSQGEKAFAQYARAEIAVRSGFLDAGLQFLADSEKQAGGKSDARHALLRGKIAALKGDEAAANKAFDDAAKREPGNSLSYFMPAALFIDLGKGDAALARLQAYTKNRNAENPAYFALLGDAHALRGKADDAAKAYQQALEKDEGNVRATMGTGRLLLEKKKWEEAGALLEKVSTAWPNNGDPWFYMGGAYIEQKDPGYAAQMSDKAVELYKKSNAEPRYLIRALKLSAKAHEMAKNKKDAEERVKAIQELEKIK